jgi:hypothetical protein
VFIYNVNIPANTTSAANATTIATIYPATNRSFMILELDFEGMGTTSTANSYGLYRTTTTAAASGAGTALTFGGSGAVSYTTAPALTAAPVHQFGLNNNGQRYFWRANPNLNNAIVVSGTATALTGGITLVALTTTASIMGRIQIAEL